MPMIWRPPEVFLEHNSVTVYHTYKGGCAASYWYTVKELDDDLSAPFDGEHAGQFDVRELPKVFEEEVVQYMHEKHAVRIAAAINSGALDHLLMCREEVSDA